ncbi:MAG: Kelch repeat-containing protein [Planctomycetota bacterium]|jgi:hypothetical protein
MRNLALSLGCLILSSTCLAQAANWVQVQTKNSPGPRWAHANAHDFIRGRTIVFGGGNANIKGNDTWEYDGKDWTQITPAGNLNDTWEYDGKTWTKMNPTNSPAARWGHGMAYDSARQRTVLYGGITGRQETWEWDGANWTQIMTKTLPPGGIYGGSIAYDSARKRVVLFGGSGYLNDTWEYDGNDWTKMNPTTRPPGAYYVAMAYDIARQRTVMFGGLRSSGLVGETWEYDGKAWVQMRPAMSPPARRDYDEMVYDQRRQRVIIYGGIGNAGRLGDTWEYVASQPLTGSPATISIATGGTHTFSLDAGTTNASRLYWIFGSVTGTTPGVTLASAVGSVTIPLIPDFYTTITIAQPNTAFLVKTKGALDGFGRAQASLLVPKINDQNAIGVTFNHAYLVYDTPQNNFYMASNPATLTLVK